MHAIKKNLKGEIALKIKLIYKRERERKTQANPFERKDE